MGLCTKICCYNSWPQRYKGALATTGRARPTSVSPNFHPNPKTYCHSTRILIIMHHWPGAAGRYCVPRPTAAESGRSHHGVYSCHPYSNNVLWYGAATERLKIRMGGGLPTVIHEVQSPILGPAMLETLQRQITTQA